MYKFRNGFWNVAWRENIVCDELGNIVAGISS